MSLFKSLFLPDPKTISSQKFIYFQAIPKFWHSINPTKPENRLKFLAFCTTIAIQLAMLTIATWVHQYTMGLYNAAEEDINIIIKTSISACVANISKALIDCTDSLLQYYILGKNRKEAQINMNNLNINNIHKNYSHAKIANYMTYQTEHVEEQSFNLANSQIFALVNLLHASYNLINDLPRLNKKPYDTPLAAIFTIPAFPLIIAVSLFYVTNFIPSKISRYISKQHTDMIEKRQELIDLIVSLQENKAKYQIHQSQHLYKKEFEKKLNDYISIKNKYKISFNSIYPVKIFFFSITTIISHIIAKPYLKDKDFMYQVSYNISRITDSLETFAGSGYHEIATFKKLNAELDEFIIQNKKMNQERIDQKQIRKFGQNNLTVTSFKLENEEIIINLHTPILLERGKITKIDGKSGTGKSSLLRAITGKNLIICESEINFPCQEESEIFYINQSQTFERSPEKSSIGHFLMFGTEDTPANRSKALNLLEKFDFSEARINKMNKNFYQTIEMNSLSGGELKKLAIVNAILKQPKILVMDEVFAGIDTDQSENIKETLKKLVQEQNMTIIYVEHENSAVKNSFYDNLVNLKDHASKITKAQELSHSEKHRAQKESKKQR